MLDRPKFSRVPDGEIARDGHPSHGLGVDAEHVERFLEEGKEAVDDERLLAILEYALLVNEDPTGVTRHSNTGTGMLVVRTTW